MIKPKIVTLHLKDLSAIEDRLAQLQHSVNQLKVRCYRSFPRVWAWASGPQSTSNSSSSRSSSSSSSSSNSSSSSRIVGVVIVVVVVGSSGKKQ